jgi:hypothetical protein
MTQIEAFVWALVAIGLVFVAADLLRAAVALFAAAAVLTLAGTLWGFIREIRR